MENNKIDAIIEQMESLSSSEKEQLTGGVFTFEVTEMPTEDTNYFQCGCNNYQCGKTKTTK